jgi:NADH-quinone oxidoreductase subunit F
LKRIQFALHPVPLQRFNASTLQRLNAMPSEYRLILKYADRPGYTPDIDCYLRHGGYESLKKALAIQPKDLPDGKKMSGPEQIRDDVKLSGLRGRGGAGFSCGLKWSFVDRRSGKPIYLICNADESEPGTFKDRQIIHKDPHQLIEGMIISCYANDVHLAYIYIRGEMPEGARLLNKAIQEARAKNFLGKNILGSGYDLEIHVHRGAGAYICGEETGLIESLEGKRPYPRIKPPYFPAVLGLYMCPTIVNNVETLCNVKHIIAMGASEWAKLGTPNNTGTRIVSLSGHVKKPGYYEIETGKVTIGQLINDPAFGGGLRDGRKLKAVIPGGSSAKVFKAGEKFKLKRKVDGKDVEQEVDMLDLPYDFDSLIAAGSMSGSSAIIVMDDSVDIVEALANISEFYAHESCGQCTPCREGSLWMSKALHRMTHGEGRATDADYLVKIADNIPGGRTICAFGEACSWPVQSFVAKFKEEFVAKGKADEERRTKHAATPKAAVSERGELATAK